MEHRKRARYSKPLDAEELNEILMEEESDEELEEERNMSSSSSSSSSDEADETDITFRDRRAEDSPRVLDFTGPPSGINRRAAPNIKGPKGHKDVVFVP